MQKNNNIQYLLRVKIFSKLRWEGTYFHLNDYGKTASFLIEIVNKKKMTITTTSIHNDTGNPTQYNMTEERNLRTWRRIT